MSRDLDTLHDILDMIELVGRHGPDDEMALRGDVVLQAATLHWIQTIGEAVGRLSAELRERYPELPWRQIADMRNLVVHGYNQVDLAIVWRAVERDLPPLEAQVR